MNQLIEELITPGTRELNAEWMEAIKRVKELFLQKQKNEIHIVISSILKYILYILTIRDTDEIIIYNPDTGIYENEGEVDLKRLIHSIHPGLNRHDIQEILSKVRNQTYINANELNNPEEIVLKNGVFNWEEQTLDEFRPQYLHTSRLEINYDPDAIPTFYYNFIDQILEEEYHDIIQELFGYCLIEGYPFNKAFLFTGAGANGKSTLLNLITTFLGKRNVAHILLQDLDKPFTKTSLLGKKANICADLPSKAIRYTGFLKILTGEDIIETDRKFQSKIEFYNSAKMIFAANKAPAFENDDTYAIWRRVILIEFKNKFIGKNCDPFILSRLTTDAELSGLFNYALKGKERLQENRGFSTFKTVEQTRTEYLTISNTIQAFVDQCLVKAIISEQDYEEVWRRYLDFCISIDQPPKNKTSLTKDLPLFLPTAELRRSGNKKYWKGFHFKEENEL